MAFYLIPTKKPTRIKSPLEDGSGHHVTDFNGNVVMTSYYRERWHWLFWKFKCLFWIWCV